MSSLAETTREDRREDSSHVLLELKYCERCGALGVQRAPGQPLRRNPGHGPAPACKACMQTLAWLLEVPR